MPKSYEEYLKQAQQEYDPSYNTKVTAINNALNSNLANLDTQITGITNQANQQEEEQNTSNTVSKNNFDAVNTGRGLGRSTILTTGLAGMDDRNNQLLGKIRAARDTSINNVNSQKNVLSTNANNEKSQLAQDRESVLANLIRQYQQTDADNEFKREQFEFQKQQAAQQLAASVARARAASNSKGSSASAAASKQQKINDAWEQLYNMVDDNRGSSFLKNYRNSLITNLGQAEYAKMLSYVQKNGNKATETQITQRNQKNATPQDYYKIV